MIFYPFGVSKFPTSSTKNTSSSLPTMLSYTFGFINGLKNVLHKACKSFHEEKLYKNTTKHDENFDCVPPVYVTDSIVLIDESTYNCSDDLNDGGYDREIEIQHYDDLEDFSDIHDFEYRDYENYDRDIEIQHYDDLEDFSDIQDFEYRDYENYVREIDILYYDDLEDFSDIHDFEYRDNENCNREIIHYDDLIDTNKTTTYSDITSTIIGDSCFVIIQAKTSRAY